MTESDIALEGPPSDRRIGEMDTEGAMDDISVLLIAKKAGYGLAPDELIGGLLAVVAGLIRVIRPED